MDNIFDLETSTAPIFDNTSSLMPSCPWIEMLNPEQKLAVQTTEGPVLVLSGAGTGKTKVLTTRLAYILSNHKANPWECLVVTFTNRAAKEMKERVENLIGDAVNSVWLGTFHSICVKILRNHPELVGLNSNFTILAEDDQKRLLKQIMEINNFDIQKYPPQSVLDKISRWKDKGLTPDKISSDFKENILTEIYKLYQNRLLELNCVDFGDIILYTIKILMEHKDILERYQSRFKYIMIDEYQDTNVSQYLLIRLLSQKHRNLCCVGDDDQSIYSWRGAEVENILSFQKIFPNALVIRLERNYRSTAHILGAASGLISCNQGRLGKTLKPADELQGAGEKVRVTGFWSGSQEAESVVTEILKEQQKGVALSDMAILVRATFQTRQFEEVLMRTGIPYKIIGGFKFYEREEIKDAVAYLRLVLNPNDDLAFLRIVNKPKRGVGPAALDVLNQAAKEKHISLF